MCNQSRCIAADVHDDQIQRRARSQGNLCRATVSGVGKATAPVADTGAESAENVEAFPQHVADRCDVHAEAESDDSVGHVVEFVFEKPCRAQTGAIGHFELEESRNSKQTSSENDEYNLFY